jgi:hypothetical protein
MTSWPGTDAGLPDWAIFCLLGYCLLLAVLWKLQK